MLAPPPSLSFSGLSQFDCQLWYLSSRSSTVLRKTIFLKLHFFPVSYLSIAVPSNLSFVVPSSTDVKQWWILLSENLPVSFSWSNRRYRRCMRTSSFFHFSYLRSSSKCSRALPLSRRSLTSIFSSAPTAVSNRSLNIDSPPESAGMNAPWYPSAIDLAGRTGRGRDW